MDIEMVDPGEAAAEEAVNIDVAPKQQLKQQVTEASDSTMRALHRPRRLVCMKVIGLQY
jgi:hypothetical protein